MALIGTIELLQQQVTDSKLKQALNYLKQADLALIFSEVMPGKNKVVEIDGKRIYAIFQEYDTKLPENVKIEGHKKYIDIQYIFYGAERMFLSSYNEILENGIYNDEKDILFPTVTSYWKIDLKEGVAAIFHPEDLHGPCCCIEKPSLVRKIVIKVEA